MFEKIREAEKSAPMGTILRSHLSVVIGTACTPSRRFVVLSIIRVPMVANVKCHVVRKIGLLVNR